MASISKRASGAWQNTSYGIRATATDTITTLPTTIYGDGTNATISINGNTTQSGTPTPDSPIMPQGTGERTGNLFDKSKRTDKSRVVYTTGEIDTLNGVFVSDFTPIEPNTTYTLNIVSSINSKTGHLFALYDENKNFVNTGAHEASSATVYTFTTPSNVAYIRFNGNMASVDEIMLNLGSTALPYEPYGYKIPISSAGQTTPVYLGEVQTTRKIRKVVLTGEESFGKNSGSSTNYLYHTQRATTLPMSIGKTPILCNELPVKDSPPQNYIGINTINDFSVVYFNFGADVMNAQPSGNTVAGLKEYLAAQYAAGTPVCVWYVLATEETAVVNEQLMKIDGYADEVNGISIPTTDGANTLSVDTTVQPSEVSINYHGWHMGTVHERVSGEWD